MNEIIPYRDMQSMAETIAKSGLFGIKKPEEALALMLVAQAEGRHPAIIARDYHIISGRPALKADAMLARFQEAKGRIKWITLTDDKAEAEFSHPEQGSVTICWDTARWKKAGLGGNGMWAKYPRQMLRSRVISEGVRTILPGCVCGVYEVEETRDMALEKPVDAQIVAPVQGAPVQDVKTSPKDATGTTAEAPEIQMSSPEQQAVVLDLINRLGWAAPHAVNWLRKHYGVSKRSELTDDQAVDAVGKLEILLNPPAENGSSSTGSGSNLGSNSGSGELTEAEKAAALAAEKEAK